MTQHTALRLARELEACPTINYKAHAAELRRLVAENESLRQIVEDFPPIEAELREVSDSAHRMEAQRDQLLEALKAAEPYLRHADVAYNVYVQARAAIKAVEGETK